MDVTWLGHGCFRLRGRGAAVVTDPYPPAIGLKLSRMDAEVVTVSHDHGNHSYTQAVRDGAYEIHGPGEYEIAGVSVIGVPTYHDSEKGKKEGRNTVYLIEIDDVRICHLGDLGHKLEDTEAEAVASPDVLLVPVGGQTTMNAAPSNATAIGELNVALVAGPPSPENPLVPVPAKVEMIPRGLITRTT